MTTELKNTEFKNTLIREKEVQDISSASILFSLTRLSTKYSGDCVLLRRSSDNAELAFGFVGTNSGDELDYSAIDTWRSGSDVFIKEWYDQSLFNNTASQTDTIRQPQLDTVNKKIIFDGVNDYLTVANNSSLDVYDDSHTYVADVEFTDLSDNSTVFMKGQFLAPRVYERIWLSADSAIFGTENGNAPEESLAIETAGIGTFKKYIAVRDGDDFNTYVNTALSNTTTRVGYGSLTNTTDLFIGANSGGNERLEGCLKSFLMFRKALDTDEIALVNEI